MSSFFFYRENSLAELTNKGLHFHNASDSYLPNSIESSLIRLFTGNNQRTYIFNVLSIRKIPLVKSGQQYYSVLFCDASNHVYCGIVDASLNDRLVLDSDLQPDHKKTDITQNKLRKGHVILLQAYSIVQLDKNDENSRFINFKEFIVIGYEMIELESDDEDEKKKPQSSSNTNDKRQQKVDIKVKEQELVKTPAPIVIAPIVSNSNNITPTTTTITSSIHTPSSYNCENYKMISDLSSKLNYSDWCVRACLLNKTSKKTFNNNTCSFMRCQFLDTSSHIELVAFNEQIDLIDRLELNKIYEISNGHMVYQNPNKRAWANNGFNPQSFEIQLKPHSKITLSKDQSPIIAPPANISSESSTSASISASSLISHSVNKSILKTRDGFVLLNQLVLQGMNSNNDYNKNPNGLIVDVMGVITQIGTLENIKPDNKEPIDLLNVCIVDHTNTPVQVAFWGKQARDFSLSIGSVLVGRKLEIKNFKGFIKLSVQRASVYSEMKTTDSDYAQDLYTWWTNNKNHIRTLNLNPTGGSGGSNRRAGTKRKQNESTVNADDDTNNIYKKLKIQGGG